ncbi:response regulator transcription factor [Plantactinospora sp. BB1]|uniref:response regulator transcription factor n=1 Tax=Plantactinospora sp. BB1 TaxID=2071627 RepID=UPI000D156997|nr:response regulator transcription factor [Plantactinospora sp. BB1]AVT39639.1 DNA-binding response regulator [Plantactinospora sp. BB1]
MPTLIAMHLAVVDPLPLYRRGVVAVLSAAGHAVETPDDPLVWAHVGPPGVVLLTLASEPDWDLLQRLCDTSSHAVIAVLTVESAMSGARAVYAGAQSVLARGVTPVVLQRTVEATIDGQAVLPASVVTALATGVSPAAEGESPLSTEQVTWLRHLAAGMTVAQLARVAGYSERAMFRLLHELYRQLGAGTRIEAILHAQQQGWLRTETRQAGR